MSDVSIIYKLILQAAEYEKVAHLVTATEESITSTLFTSNPLTPMTILLIELSPSPFLHAPDASDNNPNPSPSFEPIHETILTHLRLSPPESDESAEFRASSGGEVAGMVMFHPCYAWFLSLHALYVEDLFVRDEYRGMGIGKRLMKAVGKHAIKAGYGRLKWIVDDWNENAMRFYEKSIGAKFVEGFKMCCITGDDLVSFAK